MKNGILEPVRVAAFICISIILIASLPSCKKQKEVTIPKPPAASEFTLHDSLRVDSFYKTSFPDAYDRYNGKFYDLHSVNKTNFIVKQDGPNLTFYFLDSSVNNLETSFTLSLKNIAPGSLQPFYNISDSSIVALTDVQQFPDGTYSIGLPGSKILAGVLRIIYNKQFNSVSGTISNLKIPLGFYVPDDLSSFMRGTYGLVLTSSGSTRTVQLVFNNISVSQ